MTPQNKQRAAGAGALAAIIAAVFALEGGYVNDPLDRGGATNHGITEATARAAGYRGKMKDLARYCRDETDICAEGIYRENYVRKPGFMPLVAIDWAVAKEVIDTGVNMGPYHASRFFQRAVNATCNTTLQVDGKVGPQSVKAWADCRAHLGPRACKAMLDSLDQQQLARYDWIVKRNPSQRRFYRGWINWRIGNVDRKLCA